MDQPVRLEKWNSGSVSISGAGRPDSKVPEPPNAGKYGFNMKFLRGLAQLVTHGEKRDLLLILSLVGTIILNLYIGSITGTITGQFYEVIVQKDASAFKQVLWKSAIILIFSALLESAIKLNLDMISYRWRRSLVTHIHSRYFSHSMFYQILHLDHTIDNPDQRIVQDVDLLTKSLGQVLRVVFEAPLTIAFYTYMTVTTITWYSPLLVLGYWIFAAVLNKLLMNPSAVAVFRQEQLEGNFRFSHLRLRTYAESIAMYGGGKREQEIAATSFEALLRNRIRLIGWETSVTTTTNVFAYFASAINYAIVSLPIFQGWKIPGSAGGVAKYVSNSSFRLLMLINGFTQINNISRDLSDFIGYSNRVAQMLEVMNKLDKSKMSSHFQQPFLWLTVPGESDYHASLPFYPSSATPSTEHKDRSQLRESSINASAEDSSSIQDVSTQPQADTLNSAQDEPEEVVFDNVTVYTPDSKLLVRNLSVTIPIGCNLLISGPSGSGKTSLLRCLSGLWRNFEGTIERPSSVLFVPQRPYLPFGSLQDQVVYPLSTGMDLLKGFDSPQSPENAKIDSEQLWSLLKAVELEYLVYRPHACGIASDRSRESIREFIEDQETDSSETTKLLSTAAQAANLRSVLRNLIDEMEASNLNWTEVLSPGEQQRIGLARVLFHKPRFAILDEATSSIDEPMETKFYEMCKQLNITLISVGHKSNLIKFHNRSLKLDRKGNWELRHLRD